MRRFLHVTIAMLAILAVAAAIITAVAEAKQSPLAAHLTMTAHDPTRITATITATEPTVVGIWRIDCGSHHATGRYTARSGVTHALTLPSDHTGVCVLHLTGETSGYHVNVSAKSQSR